MLTNHGQPYIYVVDGNYANRGELYLAHKHIGVELDIKYATECLINLHKLWRRPVQLQARIKDDMLLFCAAATPSASRRSRTTCRSRHTSHLTREALLLAAQPAQRRFEHWIGRLEVLWLRLYVDVRRNALPRRRCRPAAYRASLAERPRRRSASRSLGVAGAAIRRRADQLAVARLFHHQQKLSQLLMT